MIISKKFEKLLIGLNSLDKKYPIINNIHKKFSSNFLRKQQCFHTKFRYTIKDFEYNKYILEKNSISKYKLIINLYYKSFIGIFNLILKNK